VKLKPVGITALQYTALTVLERHDGVSAAQLARDSFVTVQSMADMVRALENRGLIRREPNPCNRREKIVLLADAGHRLLDLSPEEIVRFRDALNRAWS
jgi:DNA-binding MarR family transcriptional regulator